MGKMKYYVLKDILTKNADYNIIIGERSNGKTYSCLKYAIEQYFISGKQSAYIRRWKDDIIGKRAESVFSAIVSNEDVFNITKGKYTNIIYSRGKWYLGNYDDVKKRFIADTTPFCFAFSLSDVEHDKSTSYPNIDTIIFDEFLSRRAYLPDEFVIFMNVLSTIIRERSGVKIFMLGNTVNKYCPYFDEMGLVNISTMLQGSIDVYSYGDNSLKVAVEYCATLNAKKKSNKYFAFNNPKLNMITGGSWEIAIYPHLENGKKIKNKDIVFSFYVLFNNKIIQGDIVEDGSNMFLFFHNKTTVIKDEENSLIYSLNPKTSPNYRRNLLSTMGNLDKKIAYFFAVNKVFYQSNDIGEIIHNYLLQCTK